MLLLIGCSSEIPERVSGPTEETGSYEYFVLLPVGYEPVGEEGLPLILFLHGSGGGSDSRDLVSSYGVPKRASDQRDFPFIVVAPQTDQTLNWSVDRLNNLLDEIESLYRIDEDRIYVTGLSMGGNGTWLLAMSYPNRFAAIAPVAGSGITSLACKIQHIPAWIFHNDGDPVIPSAEGQKMYDALQDCGSGNVELTIYQSDSHDAWTRTYSNQELYEWFLSHKRESE